MDLYSIRMRAAQGGSHEQGGKHISGGEQIAAFHEIQDRVSYLLRKALEHDRGNPDFLQLTIDLIVESVQILSPLSVYTHTVNQVEEGRNLAMGFLRDLGLKEIVIDKGFKWMEIANEVRGAILVDAITGERIDQQGLKGVRATRLDWKVGEFEKWCYAQQLQPNIRLKEALALATKISHYEGVVAELCWSDDPNYVIGYVSSKILGYHRITKMKEHGDENGGRVIFVNPDVGVNDYIQFLEKTPILLKMGEYE
ncbi:6-carboxyhexanoate--CoA ligase [Tepidibacillus marianensis]|uniref:6-carboxyhexanoate--CoA ligase n=1 Tax=Tepidibacillus marianensis TaxID=3131995 RepID=UPI0030D0D059